MSGQTPSLVQSTEPVVQDRAANDDAFKIYVPLSFLRESLKNYVFTRFKARDAALFLVFFCGYIPLIAFEYFSQTEQSYWAHEAFSSQLSQKQLRPLKDIRTLRAGEVDQYHAAQTFNNVMTADDWHAWFEDIAIGTLFNRTFPTVSSNVNNFYDEAGQMVKVGALRVRVTRMLNKCTSAETTRCYSSYSSLLRNHDTSAFGPMPYVDCKQLTPTEGDLSYYYCSGNVFDIPFNLSFNDAIARARTLNSDTFQMIDFNSVRFISVEMVFYLPAQDSLLLASAFMEVPLGGGFVPNVITYNIPIGSKNTTWGLWALCATVVVFVMGVLAYRIARRSLRRLKEPIVSLLLWGGQLAFVIVHLAILAARVGLTPDFQLRVDDVAFSNVWAVVMLSKVERHIAAICALFLFLRFLSFVRLLPYVSIVVRTMASASRSLFGIFFIIIVVLTGYAIAGFIMFGDLVVGFRGFPAISTVTRAIFGDFDFEALRDSSDLVAPLYYWPFMIVNIFILLNFFVGVLSSVLEREDAADQLDEFEVEIRNCARGIESDMKKERGFQPLSTLGTIRYRIELFMGRGPEQITETIFLLWEQEKCVILEDVWTSAGKKDRQVVSLEDQEPLKARQKVAAADNGITTFALPNRENRHHLCLGDVQDLHDYSVDANSGIIEHYNAAKKYISRIDPVEEDTAIRVWSWIIAEWKQTCKQRESERQPDKKVADIHAQMAEITGFSSGDNLEKVDQRIKEISAYITAIEKEMEERRQSVSRPN